MQPHYRRMSAGGRVNMLRAQFMSIITMFHNYHRLMLEVFIRKNFGERYFTFSSAITVVVFLSILPLGIIYLQHGIHYVQIAAFQGMSGYNPPFEVNYFGYVTWYIFIGFFLHYSLKHHRAKRPSKSRFDFSKYSLYGGDFHPWFEKQKFSFIETNTRTVECFFEPAPFFIAGLFLALIGQYLGWLLIVSSIIYCISYVSAYEAADHHLLDMIDDHLRNIDIEEVFVEGVESARKVTYRGTIPEDIEHRRKLVSYLRTDREVYRAF